MVEWRKLLIGGGAALAGAAAYNALARRRVRDLENLIGGDERWFGWRGWRIAYTVRGNGPAVLLVHSIHAAAWSYEWRANVQDLARSHTVYSIDLLGFGASARPAVRYSARLYQALIDDFVEQVVRTPIALVASSLSAAFAIALGARNPEQYPALVLVAPTGLVRFNDSAGITGDLTRMAVETPVFGTAAFNSMVSRGGLRRYLERVYANDARVTSELVDDYYAAAHQPGAKHAPTAFFTGQLNFDVRKSLRRLQQPALLVWGEQAVEAPLDEARNFLAVKPDFEFAILSPAGDLPHDERPEEFNELARDFLARTWSLPAVTDHPNAPELQETGSRRNRESGNPGITADQGTASA